MAKDCKGIELTVGDYVYEVNDRRRLLNLVTEVNRLSITIARSMIVSGCWGHNVEKVPDEIAMLRKLESL